MNDFEITEAMLNLGGSFAQQFGRLYRCADPVNQARLRDAFPELWDNYRIVAESYAKSAAAASQGETR